MAAESDDAEPPGPKGLDRARDDRVVDPPLNGKQVSSVIGYDRLPVAGRIVEQGRNDDAIDDELASIARSHVAVLRKDSLRQADRSLLSVGLRNAERRVPNGQDLAARPSRKLDHLPEDGHHLSALYRPATLGGCEARR